MSVHCVRHAEGFCRLASAGGGCAKTGKPQDCPKSEEAYDRAWCEAVDRASAMGRAWRSANTTQQLEFIINNVIQVSKFIRVEPRRPRRTVVATEELLADKVTPPRYRLGGRDALGNVIELDKEMTFIDDKAPLIWCVYREEDEVVDVGNGKTRQVRRYLEKSTHETAEAATQAAAILFLETADA